MSDDGDSQNSDPRFSDTISELSAQSPANSEDEREADRHLKDQQEEIWMEQPEHWCLPSKTSELLAGEKRNHAIQIAICDAARPLEDAMNWALSEILVVERYVLGSEETSDYVHSDMMHEEQQRVIVGLNPNHDWVLRTKHLKIFGGIMVELIKQHHFFLNDCCVVDKFVKEARDHIESLIFYMNRLEPEKKMKMMMEIPNLAVLPRELRDMISANAGVKRSQPQNLVALGASQQAHLLVTPPPPPTDTTMVPGSKEHANFMRYLSLCRSGNHPARISQWHDRVKLDIGQRWRVRYPSKKKDSWQVLPIDEILKFLEELLPANKTDFNAKPAKRFSSYLVKNPLEVDFGYTDQVTHPLLTQTANMMIEWRSYDIHAITRNEEKEFCKSILKTISIINCAKDAIALTKSDLNRELREEHTVPGMLDYIEDYVITQVGMLNRMQAFMGFPATTGSSRSSKSASTPYVHPSSDENKNKQLQDFVKERRQRQAEQKLRQQKHKQPAPQQQEGKSHRLTNPCQGCGWGMKRNDDGVLSCPRNKGTGCDADPRRNNSSASWAESATGKAWMREGGYYALPSKESVTLENAKKSRFKGSGHEGKYTFMVEQCNILQLTQHLIPFSLDNVQPKRKDPPTTRMKTGTRVRSKARSSVSSPSLLLDTGAIGSSVISTTFYNNLLKSNFDYKTTNACHELSTAMVSDKLLINKQVEFTIYLTSERNIAARSLPITLTAIVAPISVDLILDREAIKRHNLVAHFPSHFAKGPLLESLTSIPAATTPQITPGEAPANKSIACKIECKATTFKQSRLVTSLQAFATRTRRTFKMEQQALASKNRLLQESIYNRNNNPVTYLATLSTQECERYAYPDSTATDEDDIKYNVYLAAMASNFSSKSAFERDGNLAEIPDNKLEAIPAELISAVHDLNEHKKVIIEGPPLVQARIRKLVEDFQDVFRSTVQDEPAKLKPFMLKVDETKWHTPANMLRCRKIDREREVELEKLVDILLEHKIIEPSDDSYYSHAFLVPKPNGKWRLVLDFKNLNSATTNYYKWPLPDIKEMLHRVGNSRPLFFAVFDLTSGYYQAPIAEESRSFTAFVTRHGVYRWLRLPMGLTGAGSYFQHSLVTQVLNGLMHDGCELFMDDCMIHAQTLDQYCDRLETVFLRFREKRITLNPLKCKLGLPQVEYVGHTINEDGLHFTRDKLDSVLNFPRPETKRQVKSFLGLANYFRDHIKNHSMRVQPLQDLVSDYEKRQARHKVNWTPESIAAFEDIRQAIDECPMLWFLDDFSAIFLQTDASDYGIGAYLYQIVELDDGSTLERPVGFISKSIAGQHLSWDTPMKEGFAIFYALKKWEYLLRDRKFTILTDHENLTRLRVDHDSNKMVKRWFMAFQEFDIMNWKHVKGVDNKVPDDFSRMCLRESEEHPATMLFQLTGYEIPPEHWDTIARFHNNGTPFESGPGGHGGVQRTLEVLDAANLDWPQRTKHVRRFIRMCPCCQKMDQMKPIIHSYPFTTSSYGLWNTISVDYIENLKCDEFGNNMIIVIIDNFSRFVDLYPCNSTNAEGAADALLSFVGRYATPLHFTTDCGSNFKSTIIAGLMERLGADHHLTKAYSKEQNAIVERENKEILRHLRNLIFDKRIAAKWSKYTPIVQRVVNTSKNSSTGVTPAEIVFPNGIQLDKSLLTESSAIYMSSYIKDLQQAQARIIALAEKSLREKDEKHIENYSTERTKFPDNTYVLVEHRHNSLRRGPKSKLLPFLKGPMLVKSHSEDGEYVLQDIVTQKVFDYHVSRLRPFRYDERTMTPLQVAVTDTLDEFVAESVIQMRGDTRKQRKNLSFKIRWAGYGPDDDTWEPWEYCRDSMAVQRFLREHANARVRRLAKPVDENQMNDNESDDEP